MHQTRRKCNAKLCAGNPVPPASVVRACLGPSLAQVFFEYTHQDTIGLLDVLTPAKKSRTCWSISSDEHVLEKKVAPPTDHQVVKAFVHQNILEIGETLLEGVKREIEESLRDKVERQSREKFYMYQAKKRREAELDVQQLHERYKSYVETVRGKIQKQLEIEWSKAATECAKNTQKAVAQERMNVIHEMMRKMRAEMTYVVQELYKEFEEMFASRRDVIIADFNQIMRQKHVKLRKEMQEFEEKVSRELCIQRRQFEMRNAADVMYVLCMERLRSNNEMHIMHKYFQQQIDEIHKLIGRLKDVATVMRKEIVDCHVEKKLLAEQLCSVTKHFQKFIDFVFCAIPGQADYLLPLELQRLISIDKDEEDKNKEVEKIIEKERI
ncbi:uncharacterized protein LOC143430022 [Xylocopa sonorina]|uniref:uncharacterized protein LOC143430022 n=1 Tax=Xylocopa sonorina TaxID=1818115 RepID=UPI00403AA7A5